MGAVDKKADIRWDNALEYLSHMGANEMAVLKNRAVAVTGATGLIGSQLVRVLLAANEMYDLGVKIVLPVRNAAKANALFGFAVRCIPWELGQDLDLQGITCDLFVHTACTTSSKDFSERPVETALGIIEGTSSCLKAAKESGCKAFVYLSTMEVFGEPTAKPAKEEDLGFLDPMSPRNSYPLAKLACENLTASFGAEYGIRSVVLRLTQTFGAGVNPNDGRVFAEFARCASKGENITLLSDGSKRNSYLAVDDAVAAIVAAMLSADANGVYNVANPETYCSIREMAEMVLREFGAPGAKVEFGFDPARAKTFRKGNDIQLDVSRLEALGWKPSKSLPEMYGDVLKGWELAN